MSKYADIEQITKVIRTEWVKYIPMELDVILSFVLGKISEVPTIEISEEKVKTSQETLTISDDAISREYLKSFGYINKGDFNSVKTIREWVDNAPSVVPTQNNAVQHVESVESVGSVGKPKEDKWIIHKINGIPHTVECSHCHQHYDYEELRRLGRSKGCIDIPHCPNCGAKMKGADE